MSSDDRTADYQTATVRLGDFASVLSLFSDDLGDRHSSFVDDFALDLPGIGLSEKLRGAAVDRSAGNLRSESRFDSADPGKERREAESEHRERHDFPAPRSVETSSKRAPKTRRREQRR